MRNRRFRSKELNDTVIKATTKTATIARRDKRKPIDNKKATPKTMGIFDVAAQAGALFKTDNYLLLYILSPSSL